MSAWDGRPRLFQDEADAWAAARVEFFDPIIARLAPLSTNTIGGREMQQFPLQGGGVQVLWDDYKVRAVATVFRNQGNWSVLVTHDALSEHAAAVQAEREACAAYLTHHAKRLRLRDAQERGIPDAMGHSFEADAADAWAKGILARGDTSALDAAVEAARREEREACAVMLEAEVVRIDALALGLAAKPPEETKPNHIERLNVTLACAMKVKECVKAIRARSEGKEGV